MTHCTQRTTRAPRGTAMNHRPSSRAPGVCHSSFVARHSRVRCGFNLIELLIALAITGALLTATLVSLNASFMAYQSTTEVASTHSISRLALYRMLTMIRMGKDFGPYPNNPLDSTVYSDFMEFAMPDGQIMTLDYVENEKKLNVQVTDPGTGVENTYTLLEGVLRQTD